MIVLKLGLKYWAMDANLLGWMEVGWERDAARMIAIVGMKRFAPLLERA